MIVIESLNHINIPTEDIEKTVEFYTMLLDFESTTDENGDTYISFDDKLACKLAPVESIPDRGSMPLLSFLLDVDDFTEALQEIENNDIDIVDGPNEIKGGENILIADPSGNLLELFYRE